MTSQRQDKERIILRLQETLSAALQSNRSGIECLHANNVARALTHFSIAFRKHDKVKSILVAKMERTGRLAITNRSIDTTVINAIERDMADWFVRDLSPTLGNLEEGTEEENKPTEALICREPILLPLAIDTLASNIVTTVCNTTSQQLSELSLAVSIMELLTTCHAYNLGLATHLYGLEILSTAGGGQNSDARIHFNRAGKSYEFTMRQLRSRIKEHERHRNNNNNNNISSQISYGPQLIVVLGCLNNLADLYQKTNQLARSRRCYKQLKTTTERLYNFLQENNPFVRINLPLFLTRSREGLSRLRRTSNSSESSSDEMTSDDDRESSSRRTPSPPFSQYVSNSSSAGAA